MLKTALLSVLMSVFLFPVLDVRFQYVHIILLYLDQFPVLFLTLVNLTVVRGHRKLGLIIKECKELC